MIDVRVPAPQAAVAGQVLEVIALIERVLPLAKAMARFTRTEADDKAIEAAEKALAFIKKYASEPWAVQLIELLASLFAKGNDAKSVLKALQEALPALLLSFAK